MKTQASAGRLAEKTWVHALEIELRHDYALSPIEAQVLARHVRQIVVQQASTSRGRGQVSYQAIAMDEPAGKPLRLCRKVQVHLTIVGDSDAEVWTAQGSEALRRLRVKRITYEALAQGGALSQEDIACILGLSERTIKRIFATFREEETPLPSRGEIQDIGPGTSHKVPLIRRYVADMAFSRISRELGGHGLDSMVRYLQHFARVMILEDRGLTPSQISSVGGMSESLVGQYQRLYHELDCPEYRDALDRLKRNVYLPSDQRKEKQIETNSDIAKGLKGGLS